MNLSLYLGQRVFPGPSLLKNYDFNFLGTIIKNEVHRDKKVVRVQWDRNCKNYFNVGESNKFDLLVYDSSQSDKCDNCQVYVTGAKWVCIECKIAICVSCYMDGYHIHHNFYRVDKPNKIGIFVGKRRPELKMKCCGIFKGSEIKEANSLSLSFTGKVDSFLDKKKYYRSYVKIINSDNTIMKQKFGYDGCMEICLKNINDENNSKPIYRNHLKIMGLHPIFNYEFWKLYENDLKSLIIPTNNEILSFDIDDSVYVDCFDDEHLRRYQNSFGESNEKVFKLIGKCGSIKSYNENVIEVYFSDIQECINFNPKILFNKRNSCMTMVRMTNEIKLNELIEAWKSNFITEKRKDIYWVADRMITAKIQNKVGVIIFDNLPGDLVGVRFKMYPDFICMLLPKTVCLNIDEYENNSELTNYFKIDLSQSEEILYKSYEQYIINNDIAEFKKLYSNNTLFSLWHKLMLFAIKNANVDIVNVLIENTEKKDLYLNKLIRMKYNNFILSENYMKIIIEAICQFDTDTNGETLLHTASRLNDIYIVKIILEKDNNLVNSINEINGYSSLHYATENEHIEIIKLLMEYNCNIYLTTKLDKSTVLHMALKYYCLESFFSILESLTNDLDTSKIDNDTQTILHLSASFPNEIMLKKWNNLIANSNIESIKIIMEKFQSFQSKSKYMENVVIETMPSFILSMLILSKGKNGFKIWMIEKNKKNYIPEKIFLESIKSNNISIKTINNCFNLFYKDLDSDCHDQFCQFCHLNYASIVYHPCKHKIHCDYCSFMPYKCTQCNQDIESKTSEIQTNNCHYSFDNWIELSRVVKGDNVPKNMSEWIEFVRSTIIELECKCCKSNNWNVVLQCSHVMCEECHRKWDICFFCRKKTDYVIIKRD